MDLDEFIAEKQHKKKIAAYRWQDEAVNYAKALGFAPNKGWFRFFKQNFEKYEPRFRSILEMASNPNINNKDKYFFWMFYNQGKDKDANKPKPKDSK